MATIKNPTIRHFLTGVVFISLQAMLSAAEEGTLITPANMPITAQGKQIGNMTLQAGTKVQVMRQEGAKTLIKTSMGETWADSASIATGQNPIPPTKTAGSPIKQPSPAIAQPKPLPPDATPLASAEEPAPPTVAPKPTPTATPKPASTPKVLPPQGNTPAKDPLLAADVWDGTTPLPGEWEEWASGPDWQIKTCTKPAAFLGYTQALPLSEKAEYRNGKLVRLDLCFVDRHAAKKVVEAAKIEISKIEKASPPDEAKLADAKKRLAAAEGNAIQLQGQVEKWLSEVIRPIVALVRDNFNYARDAREKFMGDENYIMVFHGASGGDTPDSFSIAITRRYQPEEYVKPAKPDPADAAPRFWALDPEFWSDAHGQNKMDKTLFGAVPDSLDAYTDPSLSMVNISYHSKWYKGTPQEKVERYHEVEKTVLSNLLAYFPATWKNAGPAAWTREFANDTFTASMFADENNVSVLIRKVKK